MNNLSFKIKQVDLLSLSEHEGIQLKANGKYYKGLCPFHSEKTPSLVIRYQQEPIQLLRLP